MKKISSICFIVPNYPTKDDPMYTFVRELILSLAELGIECHVIAPQSVTNFIYKTKRKRPFHWVDKKDYLSINIYQPIHFPFLDIGIKGYNLSGFLTKLAIKYTFLKNYKKINPDILYAHFWHSGVIATEILKNKKIPVFVATGESKIWVQKLYNKKNINQAIKKIEGVISVSSKNLEESVELGLCKEEQAKVIPNAIDSTVFYKKNKNQIRKKLGFLEEDFIISFTGAFTHRKGIKRLEQAVQDIEGVKVIYIGSGELIPEGENILFSGRLPHNQVVNYLNASDVFVLPTLAEGCSNAIIEAMACGLPIISSDLSFNHDILNEKNSILIDPNNVDEIKEAIVKLKNNKKILESMSMAALETSIDLRIEERGKKILSFIERSI